MCKTSDCRIHSGRWLEENAREMKAALVRHLLESVVEYVDQVQGSDGLEFWAVFGDENEMVADFAAWLAGEGKRPAAQVVPDELTLVAPAEGRG
jgi:hypothetical protein